MLSGEEFVISLNNISSNVPEYFRRILEALLEKNSSRKICSQEYQDRNKTQFKHIEAAQNSVDRRPKKRKKEAKLGKRGAKEKKHDIM